MIIDLRSDTVTKPTLEMLDAMFSAHVGDDVFGEDPTIIELEQFAAEMFGKEAAILCPSGTMTNQIALNIHLTPGDEVICDRTAHIYLFEGGGIARNCGASARLINGDGGKFTAEDVLANINPADIHHARTALVEVENTLNKGGGGFWDINELRRIKQVCTEKGLKFHCDGARLFNALAVTGETPKQHGEIFDSMSICLSKGLGAPVGSLLLGTKDFVTKARRIRKVRGGAMRQAGFLAAAGLYALKNNVKRLKEDHARAKTIGDLLKTLPYVEAVLPSQTNILIFKLKDSIKDTDFIAKLAAENIKALPFGPQHIRFVTHLDFTDPMLEKVLTVLKTIGI